MLALHKDMQWHAHRSHAWDTDACNSYNAHFDIREKEIFRIARNLEEFEGWGNLRYPSQC